MIHVSGVGLLGAFVLHGLKRRGIPFTWDEVDGPQVSAWKASTGAVIPCEDRDQDHYAHGYRFWRDNATQWAELQPFLEPVETLYLMKNPPSRVTRKWQPEIHGPNRVWREDLPGWQFDVNQFVEHTRAQFASFRQPKHPDAWVLRARGVQEQLNRPTVVWGWRGSCAIAPVPGSGLWSKSGLRPVIHFNDPARAFERFYFHPRAGSPNVWWCGSEAVLQKAPMDAPMRALKGFQKYQDTVQKRFNGLLQVTYHGGQLSQGWRAKARVFHKGVMAQGELCWEATPRTFVALPLYKSGVQCGPWYAEIILQRMLSKGAS